jgi:fumarate hydratase class II
MQFRIERDSLGEVRVPSEALYGAQTARAVENFPISGQGIGRSMLRAMGLIKKSAAEVNLQLGRLEEDLAHAIKNAAQEVIDGALAEHFPVDVYQTGSGTSSNMNLNEVIANRANQKLGSALGSKQPVHPNDHVNLGQSSNDVFPSAIHVAVLTELSKKLFPALDQVQDLLDAKSSEFDGYIKIGRTHLQDATPIRLGQEFSAFACQIKKSKEHLTETARGLEELAIGGTAVGTGMNTHRDFGRLMARQLAKETRLHLRESDNHFEAQAARDACVRVSGALKALAIAAMKIADDLRWLSSGPRLGLGELELPAVQPGSSIMPGKVNPVICEALVQVCAQVIGNDAVVSLGGLYSNFQLNTMQPLVAKNLLESVTLLGRSLDVFGTRLLAGLAVNTQQIEANLERSLSLATALAPVLGYDRASKIAQQAAKENRNIRSLVEEKGLMEKEELDRLLGMRRQTEPDSD